SLHESGGHGQETGLSNVYLTNLTKHPTNLQSPISNHPRPRAGASAAKKSIPMPDFAAAGEADFYVAEAAEFAGDAFAEEEGAEGAPFLFGVEFGVAFAAAAEAAQHVLVGEVAYGCAPLGHQMGEAVGALVGGVYLAEGETQPVGPALQPPVALPATRFHAALPPVRDGH